MEHNYGEIIAPTKQELFIRRIQGMILSEELRPGDRLPPERELAAEMKISKTLVHEGIRELARLGFVDVLSGQGVIVADYSKTGNIDTLLSIMKYQEGHLDKRMAYSILDLRLETEAASLMTMARNRDSDELRQLSDIVKKARALPEEEYDDIIDLVVSFHHLVFSFSDNVVYPLVFNAFSAVTRRFWVEYTKRKGIPFVLDGLDSYVSCLKDGRGEDAVQILNDEIEWAKTTLY